MGQPSNGKLNPSIAVAVRSTLAVAVRSTLAVAVRSTLAVAVRSTCGWALLLTLSVSFLGGCAGDPVSTVPLDGAAAGTRTATPEGRSFSDIQPGHEPRLKHLWASFVITAEQLQSAREAPLSLHPQAILPCTDCESLQWQPGSPPPTPSSRALGTYRPDQLTFSFRVQPHEISSRPGLRAAITLSGSFHLDTTTPLVHPGEGVRLRVQRALLGEEALEPLPPPQDFHTQQISRGQFQERSWILPVSLPDPGAGEVLPPLRLEVVLTSPIPPDSAPFQRGRPLPPPPGRLYHGAAWPGIPTWDQLLSYRQAIGQPPAWAAVDHLWDPRQDFPQQLASRLRESGSVPYLRLRLDPAQLSALANGDHDETLRSWARGIQRFATPIILAVVVGDRDPVRGSGTDSSLQQRAYQHLMQTLRSAGVSGTESSANLLWVVELDGEDAEALSTWANFPEMDWLSLAGDPATFASVYRRLEALNPKVPVVIRGPAPGSAASQPLLEGLEAQRWPQVIGWSWTLSPDGIPPAAAQDWRQHLQQGDPQIWLGEMQVQLPPSPLPSPQP